jgi:hypothetical protein
MTKITTIYPDGSMVETTPMGNKRARKIFNSLKKKDNNVHVLYSIN